MYIPPGGEKKWKRKQTSKETAVPYGRKLLGHTETVYVVTSVTIITVVKRTNLTFFPPDSWSEGTVSSLCRKPQLVWVDYVQMRLMVATGCILWCFVRCSRKGDAPWGGQGVGCCRHLRAGHAPWWVLSHGHQNSLPVLGRSEPRRQAPCGIGPSPGQRHCRDGAGMGHGWTKTGSSTLCGGGMQGGPWETYWGQ